MPPRRSVRSRRRRPAGSAPRRRRCAHARRSRRRRPRRAAREQPLVTRCCSVKVGVLLTRLITLTMRLTRFRSPTAACSVPSRSIATARAAAWPSSVPGRQSELADPGLAVAFGDVAGQEDQVAGAHERHVGRGRRGHRRQGDAEGLQAVGDGHGMGIRSRERAHPTLGPWEDSAGPASRGAWLALALARRRGLAVAAARIAVGRRAPRGWRRARCCWQSARGAGAGAQPEWSLSRWRSRHSASPAPRCAPMRAPGRRAGAGARRAGPAGHRRRRRAAASRRDGHALRLRGRVGDACTAQPVRVPARLSLGWYRGWRRRRR